MQFGMVIAHDCVFFFSQMLNLQLAIMVADMRLHGFEKAQLHLRPWSPQKLPMRLYVVGNVIAIVMRNRLSPLPQGNEFRFKAVPCDEGFHIDRI